MKKIKETRKKLNNEREKKRKLNDEKKKREIQDQLTENKLGKTDMKKDHREFEQIG